MKRGEIWWASMRVARASEPGKRRPVLIVQSDDFNCSNISTVIVATISSNLRLSESPGNFKLTGKSTGLRKNSVVNVSQVLTLDKSFLTDRVGSISKNQTAQLNAGLKLVLSVF
jgi:mRNA interferase MazF